MYFRNTAVYIKHFIYVCVLFAACTADAQNLDNDFNSLLASKFGHNAFYSTALGHKDMKNHFARGYDTGQYHITNVVYVTSGSALRIIYPRILLSESYETIKERPLTSSAGPAPGSSGHVQQIMPSGDLRGLPDWNMDTAGNNKAYFCYEAKEALYGVYKISDKKYYVFWIPSYAGYEGAYNLAAADCDILYADMGHSVTEDIDFHKDEIMQAVKKNVPAADWAKSEQLKINYLRSKPRPAVMKDVELEHKMLAIAQPVWLECIKSREEELDMADATVTKIWIVSAGWQTEKNARGNITARTISTQWLARTAKNCYLADVKFREVYMGHGRYSDKLTIGQNELSLMAANILQAPCEAIK